MHQPRRRLPSLNRAVPVHSTLVTPASQTTPPPPIITPSPPLFSVLPTPSPQPLVLLLFPPQWTRERRSNCVSHFAICCTEMCPIDSDGWVAQNRQCQLQIIIFFEKRTFATASDLQCQPARFSRWRPSEFLSVKARAWPEPKIKSKGFLMRLQDPRFSNVSGINKLNKNDKNELAPLPLPPTFPTFRSYSVACTRCPASTQPHGNLAFCKTWEAMGWTHSENDLVHWFVCVRNKLV